MHMRLFALSDLHLSLAAPYLPGGPEPPRLYKPMDRFGALWENFFQRLESNWLSLVQPEDAVLIAGDISWALTLDQAQYDLDYLSALPGRKLLVKGNHDYWWQSLSRVRQAVGPTVTCLQHSAVTVGGWSVCGTRGWLLPAHADFKEDPDRHLLDRELLRLEMALTETAQSGLPRVAMLHYPPLDQPQQGSPFCDLLSRFGVTHCVYGHIHGDKAPAFEGEYQGVTYHNCSVDRLGFVPRLIAEA